MVARRFVRISPLCLLGLLCRPVRASDISFIYQRGSVTTQWGYPAFIPSSINNSGEVVGNDFRGATDPGEVWSDGTFAILRAPTGYTSPLVSQVNDFGEIAGSVYNSRGGIDPIVWNAAGVPALLTLAPGFTLGAIGGVDNSGQVVGYLDKSPTGFELAFEWTKSGTPIKLASLRGDPGSYAVSINNSGEIAGDVYNAIQNGQFQAVIWQNGTIQVLPGCQTSTANAINDRGQVVGECDGKPSLWTNGVLTILGSGRGGASDINDGGEVVGTTCLNGVCKGFIWTSATGEVLLSGFDSSTAGGINNAGEVIGNGIRSAPEPRGIALMVLAVVFLSLVTHKF